MFTMNGDEVRVYARLLLAEFHRAYCHSYNGTLRLVRDGVSYDPMHMEPLEKVRYMADTYKRVPSLFPCFVRRVSHRVAPGSPADEWCKRARLYCRDCIGVDVEQDEAIPG